MSEQSTLKINYENSFEGWELESALTPNQNLFEFGVKFPYNYDDLSRTKDFIAAALDAAGIPAPQRDNAEDLMMWIVERCRKGEPLPLIKAFEHAIAPKSMALLSFPEKAPEYWLERNRILKESPPDFIKRIYAPWLGQGLTQANIRNLDKSLYLALHQWLRFNEMPADLDLPTKAQMTDRLLKSANNESVTSGAYGKVIREAPLEVQEQIRLCNLARRRLNKNFRVSKPVYNST